jgi:preprotein translocase subunit SecA
MPSTFIKFLASIFGTHNERVLKSFNPLVARIAALEPDMKRLANDQFPARTGEMKARLAKGEPLDDLLPEAFALTREAAWRAIGQRHYDVQLLGGMALHRGMISEMKTGEGKTLVATLAASLNALTGKGVHIVTVNDYLAKRDSEWMGRIYNFLGLTVGCIVHGLDDAERQAAYGADITYGTNNEFGFDYLRDNMKFEIEHMVHRYYWPPEPEKLTEKERYKIFNYAIVDEVDSILIDEARTPLIISGPSEESTDKYYKVNALIPFLKRDQDFVVDEKAQSVALTETGVDKLERRLNVGNLYEPHNIEWLHHVNQALRAHTLFKRDVNYLMEEGKVVIIDEFTGRKMPGRRWSDGLHQAIEAKEGVKIEAENQTLATVTFQNLFRMYKKLAGMTGTAETEAEEFAKIYELEVLVIPSNKPMIRQNYDDVVYKTEREKFEAVKTEIVDCHRSGQPVLVGTVSVEKSERVSKLLKKEGIPHHVLNAKNHAREAEIVAQAGQKGAVTISTNMAGRGTDILLGGNPEFLAKERAGTDHGETYNEALAFFRKRCEEEKKEVIAAGGLHILGTERHEARRIDNQLRGRAGRQGDPGSSRFYMSLEDDLLRIFGGERIQRVMDLLKVPENEPIIHKWVTKAIESAQTRVEGHNFDIRKHLLDYDNVLNQQRMTIYDLRRRVLEGKRSHAMVLDAVDEVTYSVVAEFCLEGMPPDEWDLPGLTEALKQLFVLPISLDGIERNFEVIQKKVSEFYRTQYSDRVKLITNSLAEIRKIEGMEETLAVDAATKKWAFYEKERYLRELDKQWKQHLLDMDHLREGVGLSSYAQKDPKVLYKKEGFTLFTDMLALIRQRLAEHLYRVEVRDEREIERLRTARQQQRMNFIHGQTPGSGPLQPTKQQTIRREGRKVGRNDSCPCGSGKKYKQCCLDKDQAAGVA